MGRQLAAFCSLMGCIFATFPALAANKEEMVTLEPDSQWVVDFADDSCRLARTFGPPENRHLLYFLAPYPTSNPMMTVAGPQVEQLARNKVLSVEFGEELAIEEGQLLWGSMRSFGNSVQFLALPTSSDDADDGNGGTGEDAKPGSIARIDLQTAAAINRLKLSQGNTGLVLETGSMAEAFSVLNDCSRSLIEHWGLDVAQHENFRAKPKWLNADRVQRGLFQEVLSQLRQRDSAAAYALTFIIETDGRVSDCLTYKITALDVDFGPACEIVKRRARFEPARDLNGDPMRSYFSAYFTHRPV